MKKAVGSGSQQSEEHGTSVLPTVAADCLPSFSAVLLAGGKSSRMGRDKAFLEIDGVPLWRRQIETLRALSPAEVFISGPAREEWRGFAVVADEIPEAGPLAGIAASLRRCAASHLAVLAVDLPRMTPDFLRSLLALCAPMGGVVAMADSFYEPLAAVYPEAFLPLADAYLARGELSLQRVVASAVATGMLRERPLTPDEQSLFLNVNTPGDLPGPR